jgi:hypothetical protein
MCDAPIRGISISIAFIRSATVRFFERDETATAKATLAAREKPG